MKRITSVFFGLLISYGLSASPVNTTSNQTVKDTEINRQVLLPSGSSETSVHGVENKEISTESTTVKSTKSAKDKYAEQIKEKWGVGEFVVRQTSAGYMLDVRYRVYDKEKAKPLFSRKLRPFAIEEGSGVKYGVPASPKVGFLRQAPQHIKENKQYFLMIANPGKRVKPGDQLTLVIGDFRVEHLIVE